VSRRPHRCDDVAQAAHEAEHAVRLGPCDRPHAVGGVVEAIDRGVDRLIDTLSLLPTECRGIGL
jgi:hypothetical protein